MSVKKALKRKNETGKDEVPAGKQPKINKHTEKGKTQNLLKEKSKLKDISVKTPANKDKKDKNKLSNEIGIPEKKQQFESNNSTIQHNSLTAKGREGKKSKKDKKKKHFEKANLESVKQDQETESVNSTKKNKKKKKLENKAKNKVMTNIQEKENRLSSQPDQLIKDKTQNTTNEMRNSLNHEEKSHENKANATESSTLPKKKRELTARQKHKQLKTNERKKAKRAGTYVKVENKKKESGSKAVKEKIILPKSAEEMSSNWKKLQSVIADENASKDQSGMKKRKKPPALKRNPKFGKVEEWRRNNKKTVEKEEDKPSTPEIWFDDVDEIFLDRKDRPSEKQKKQADNKGEEVEHNPLVKPDSFKGVTKVVGMDCEMVGVGDGNENMLARVSIVNQYGEPIYDKFVKPKEKVVDYRTHVSGVRPEDLKNGEEFSDVLQEVADILKGRILVGHAIRNDLQVLYLQHPKKRIRDTSTYKPFRKLFGGRTPGLKKLSAKVLAVSVQEGEHNSIQDAQATMRLYTMYRKQWEAELTSKRRGNAGKGKNKSS